jgi:prepilin-type N-terminal cleavage/methylation domain-containing protein
MTLRSRSGFTLLELSIVLVIVGLLLAGLLKGQELLIGARVRSIIQQQDGMKAAYFGFLDRFRSPPGDYANATTAITGVSTTACGVAGNFGNGDGDGRIEIANGEFILVWEHLSKAGFISGVYTCTGNTVVGEATVPKNVYGQYVQMIYDNNYAGTAVRDQHNLKTGNNMPSDILAEIDRKVDDGNASQGSFRASTYTTSAATDPACWNTASGAWTAQPAVPNCGGATVF